MKLLTLLALIYVTSSHELLAKTNIIDGKIVKRNQFKSVIDYQIFKSNGTMSMCTGTFIQKNLILTAAHCVYNQSPQDLVLSYRLDASQIFIAPSWLKLKEQEERTGRITQLERLHVDLAIIVTSENAPLDPMSWSQHPQKAKAKIIGFGGVNALPRGKKDSTLGQKRIGDTKIEYISLRGRMDSRKSYYRSQGLFDLNYYFSDWTKSAQVSDGDSGGPVLQNGKVVGVISSTDRMGEKNHKVYWRKSYFSGLHTKEFDELYKKALSASQKH